MLTSAKGLLRANHCSSLNLLLRTVAFYELSPVTNCHLLRIVACYELSPRVRILLSRSDPSFNTTNDLVQCILRDLICKKFVLVTKISFHAFPADLTIIFESALTI